MEQAALEMRVREVYAVAMELRLREVHAVAMELRVREVYEEWPGCTPQDRYPLTWCVHVVQYGCQCLVLSIGALLNMHSAYIYIYI